jgi:hypothetical protein
MRCALFTKPPKVKSIPAGHPMLDVHEMSLGPEEPEGVPSRTLLRLGPKLTPLRYTLVWLFERSGLRLVLRESRSCYHRIRLRRNTVSGNEVLSYEDLLRSSAEIFPVAIRDADSRTEMQPDTLPFHIQRLQKVRPWLALGDFELFQLGWNQATQMLSRNADTQFGIDIQAQIPSSAASEFKPHLAVPQPATRS